MKQTYSFSANMPGKTITFSTAGIGKVLANEAQELKNGMLVFGENNKFTTENEALANVIMQLPQFKKGIIVRVKSKQELKIEEQRKAQNKAALELRKMLNTFEIDLNSTTVHKLKELAEPLFFAEEIEGKTKGQLVPMIEEKAGYQSPKAASKPEKPKTESK